MQKIKVYHFHNGSGGGVFSVIKNLLKFSINRDIENHLIYTINKESNSKFKVPQLEGAASQQLFYYSPKWNFYYTCKQLAKLLPDDKAVIVAHDWLELGMASNLGLQNPLVHFIHGDYEYYYNLAEKHEQSTDKFIAVSPVIQQKLCLAIPLRKKDIFFCRFPVPSLQTIKKEIEVLKILYCVRNLNDENKQFKILPLINVKLLSKGIRVRWTIIGDGMKKEEVENLIDQHSGVSLFPSLSNEEVIKQLPAHDLFILPSLREGFPVAVVEAMKAGVVPLVTNWEGATEKLIIEGESGYYFKTGDVDGYANTIALLHADRKLLNQLAENGVKKANELFNPFVNTKNIEAVISNAYSGKKQKESFKVYGSRLDKEWLPNVITNLIRTFGKKYS